MKPDFRPSEILKVLRRHRVQFVLIGGLAAVYHGSELVTGDVDITPSKDTKNLERLSRALKELGARIRTQDEPDGLPFDHDAASLQGLAVLNLATPFGDLDLAFSPAGTQGYPDLKREATEVTALGVQVMMASLADVVRSKAAAGRPKDLRALVELREILDEKQRPAEEDR